MKSLIVLVLFLGGFVFLSRWTLSDGIYAYDESDYVFVSRMGLAANYLDRPTLSIGEFIRTGLARGRSPAERQALSEKVRDSNDVVFYRHWHGPVYYYWLIASTYFGKSEGDIRRLSMVVPIATMILIYIGTRWLLPGRQGFLHAVLAAGFFLWSATTVSSSEIAPHQTFVFWSLLSLILLAKSVETGQRRFYYAASVAAGLDFCTMEVTFVLVLVMITVAFLERRSLRLDWGFAARSVAAFGGTVLLVWPGAILKISFLKAYLFMAYLAVFRASPWGNVGLVETWMSRIAMAPVEWIAIAVAAVLFVVTGNSAERRKLYPFLVFVGLMLAATLRVTTSTARYSLPFLPVLLWVAAGILAARLARLSVPIAYGSTGLACLAIFVGTLTYVQHRPTGENFAARSMLAEVERNHLENSALLVPIEYLPTVHCYYPGTKLRSYAGDRPEPADFQGRTFDGVLYASVPARYTPVR